MSLVDDIKVSLRATSGRLNDEVAMLADAAFYELERVGVDPRLLVDEEDMFTDANPRAWSLVKTAVTAYCKANMGYDVSEAPRFMDTFERISIDLAHSKFYLPYDESEDDEEAGD